MFRNESYSKKSLPTYGRKKSRGKRQRRKVAKRERMNYCLMAIDLVVSPIEQVKMFPRACWF